MRNRFYAVLLILSVVLVTTPTQVFAKDDTNGSSEPATMSVEDFINVINNASDGDAVDLTGNLTLS